MSSFKSILRRGKANNDLEKALGGFDPGTEAIEILTTYLQHGGTLQQLRNQTEANVLGKLEEEFSCGTPQPTQPTPGKFLRGQLPPATFTARTPDWLPSHYGYELRPDHRQTANEVGAFPRIYQITLNGEALTDDAEVIAEWYDRHLPAGLVRITNLRATPGDHPEEHQLRAYVANRPD